MIMTGRDCAHCGGLLAGEFDAGALRLVCTTCARDHWIPLPAATIRPNPANVLYGDCERAKGRRCLDCEADISSRHVNAIRCVDCGIRAAKEARDASNRRIRATKGVVK